MQKDQLEGTYKENFQLLWNFRAELLAANPGSIFEIDIKTTTNKKGDIVHVFNRLFIAFKPCLMGFWQGVDHIWGLMQLFLVGNTPDNWQPQLAWMGIVGCFR